MLYLEYDFTDFSYIKAPKNDRLFADTLWNAFSGVNIFVVSVNVHWSVFVSEQLKMSLNSLFQDK